MLRVSGKTYIQYSPQTPKDTLISRSDQHSRVSTAHERPKRAARPRMLDSLLGTPLDAPGHGLHGLYDGALHGARRLRDLREDRRARHRARRHLHLHLPRNRASVL